MRKNALWIIAAMVLLVGVLSACSNDKSANGPSAPSAPSATGSAESSPIGGAEPVAGKKTDKKIGGGGKLTMLYPAPESLDWRFGGWAVIYAKQLYAEGLTRLDADNKAIPALATEWSTADEGLTWTFKIRDDAKWSNGDKLTARDIVLAWQNTIDPKVWSVKNNTPWWTTGDVEIVNQKDILGEKLSPAELGVEAKDDHTLEIKLVYPLMSFPERAAMNWGLVLHKSAIENKEDGFSLEKIVVNGPYKPSVFNVNEKTVWVPNEHYYADVTLDEITLKIAASQTNLPAYMNNEIDIMQITAAELAAVEKDPNLSAQLVKDAAAGFKVLTYMNNSPNTILEDPRIGMALNMAIDKATLAKSVSKDTVEPTDGLITPFIDPNWPNQLGFDVAKAKQLLAEAGFPDGKGLPTIQISVSHGAVVDPFILGVKEQWEKNLGIKVNVDNIGDWGVWWTKLNSPAKRDYVGYVDDAMTVPYASPIPSLSTFDMYKKSFSGAKFQELYDLLKNDKISGEEKTKRQEAFFAANASPEGAKYKELVDKIKSASEAEKLQLAKDADKLRMESGLYIPLYSWKSLFLVKPTVKGYVPDKFFFGKPMYFNGITNVK